MNLCVCVGACVHELVCVCVCVCVCVVCGVCNCVCLYTTSTPGRE